MPLIKEPVVKNTHMPKGTFVYSDGIYDYAIVNGESLTKYYGKEPGEYESCPIHMISKPLSLLDSDDSFWMRTLLRYDALSDRPLYKMRKELLETIFEDTKTYLFGYDY